MGPAPMITTGHVPGHKHSGHGRCEKKHSRVIHLSSAPSLVPEKGLQKACRNSGTLCQLLWSLVAELVRIQLLEMNNTAADECLEPNLVHIKRLQQVL